MWKEYIDTLISLSFIMIGLVGICSYIAIVFCIRTKSYRLFKRYCIIFVFVWPYIGYLLTRSAPSSMSLLLISHHSFLFSVMHIPIHFLITDHKMLVYSISSKKTSPPAIRTITRKEILVMSALGIVGFVFLWCVFYYVIKEKMGVVY